MRFRALAIVAALAVAAPVIAQQDPGTPGAKDASRVTAGTYAADPTHTLVGWRVNHFGFNDYFGLIGDVSGTLVLDPKNPNAATVDITIPVSKILTASEGLNKHLLKPAEAGKSADFFGATPADARFVSKRVAASGTKAVITGDLTLNGVTREVALDAEFTGAGANPYNKKETVGFEATAKVKRSDFNIAYGIPLVSDEVELNITVAFEKK
ncbi:YceI family protein [Sphingomonas sp. AOB5]|uniref:YceI family protein n=1 Tax=Sphingomonas sp. AOB5 TaxID=3034017 RepID=UPI0023F774E9|nr:YceI family protein [Sphingomonas sp. AOB5]MDF7774387.1 YceI family protein [Sphingomonas sp. AOB5]